MLFYRFKLLMSGAHSSARRERWLALSLVHRFKTDEFAGLALLAHPFGRWAEAHVDAFDVPSLVIILFGHCADASDRGAKEPRSPNRMLMPLAEGGCISSNSRASRKLFTSAEDIDERFSSRLRKSGRLMVCTPVSWA